MTGRTTLAVDDPRHGFRTGYVAGCRDMCCRRAQAQYMKLFRAGRVGQLVPAIGTLRRIRALQALGWSYRLIGESGGLSIKTLQGVTHSSAQRFVHPDTAIAAARAYDNLSMIIGPDFRVLAVARRYGWPPPLAWDDDTIDDPSAQPDYGQDRPRRSEDVDHVVVERALAGDQIPTTAAERLEVLRRWLRTGRSLADLERLHGWNLHRDLRLRRQQDQELAA